MGDPVSSLLRYAQAPLPTRPLLPRWLTLVELGDDRIQLRSAEATLTIGEPLLASVLRRIAPLLDGSRSVDEIASSGGDGVEPTTVRFLLGLIRSHGLLHEGETPAGIDARTLGEWQPDLAFLGHFTHDPVAMRATLERSRFGVAGSGRLAASVAEELTRAGAAVVDADADVDILVAAVDTPLRDVLRDVNARCLERGTVWLHVALNGTTARLGPTIVPGETACFECFERRLRSNGIPVADELRDEGTLAPFLDIVAAQAALECLRLVTGFAPPVTVGRFVELDSRTPAATVEDVLRVPRCPACGRAAPPLEVWDMTLSTLGDAP